MYKGSSKDRAELGPIEATRLVAICAVFSPFACDQKRAANHLQVLYHEQPSSKLQKTRSLTAFAYVTCEYGELLTMSPWWPFCPADVKARLSQLMPLPKFLTDPFSTVQQLRSMAAQYCVTHCTC